MKQLTHPTPSLIGATLCMLAVAIGAFGSHALQDTLVANQRLSVFELANRYQFYHGLALILIAALFQNLNNQKSIKLIAYIMMAGVIIFSGSLYLLAISNLSWLGAITPVGGTLIILAWFLIIQKVWKG